MRFLPGFLHDRLILSFVGVLATLAICATYLVVVVLDMSPTGRSDRVTVQLSVTGGLFEGSAVTYRGIRVGTVGRIRVADGGAEATITLRPGVEVPRASRAQVRALSPVGEQYLDFRPDVHEPPFLGDGDRIAASAVDLPISLAQAMGSIDNLLGRVDADDLRTVLREASVAFNDSGGDLERLLVSSEQLVATLDEVWPETRSLLGNGREVGAVLADRSGELESFAGSARVLSRWLRNFDPTFQRILIESPADLAELGKFVGTLQRIMPSFLAALVATTDILYEREPHMREFLRAVNFGTDRFRAAFRDGWLHINLALAGQKQCNYDTVRRNPLDKREPLNMDGACTLTDPVWRGSEHAPPPLDR